MSILIKGMDMPKNCDRCFFCHYIHADEDHEHFYVCSLENWKKPITHLPLNPIQAKSKPEWCPLIEVPPHGRLIDADALRHSHCVECTLFPDNCLGDECDWGSIYHIDHAKTIIEAEVDDV